MTHALADHVHAAVVGDDIVLLDVRGDAYLCLPEARGRLRLAPGGRRLSPDPELLAVLTADGLVAAAGAGGGIPSRAAPAATAGLEPSGEPLTGRERAALAGALWDYARHYHGRSFAHLLAFAARGGPAQDDPERARRLAGRFQTLAPWLPIPGQCLARSFVLLRFLHRCGASARWVLGVQTWPFAAHCWLQSGEVVLDDAPERVAHYEPILVI